MCKNSSVRSLVAISILQLTAGLWAPKADTAEFEVDGDDVAVERPYHWKSSSVSLIGLGGLASDSQTKKDWLVMLSRHSSLPLDTIYIASLLSTMLAMLLIGNTMASEDGQTRGILSPMRRQLIPKRMPALAILKYISILVFWLSHKHKDLGITFHTSRLLLMLSGFVLQFAEERRSPSTGSGGFHGYFSFIVRRFAKLYPLFALSVMVAALMGYYRQTCRPISSLLVLPALVQNSECATGQWFIPVIMACYMIFPIFSAALKRVSFKLTWVLVCLCTLVVQLSYSDAFSFKRQSFMPSLPSFLLGMALARLWIFLAVFDWYSRFCELVCPGSLMMLLLANVYRSTLRRFAIDVQCWCTFWQCMLLIGYAGPCESSTAARFNPLLKLLSWERLEILGELTLPLYMTNFMAVEFVNRQFKIYGYPTGTGQHLVAEFIFMHLLAWMFYTCCASIHGSKPGAEPAEPRPARKEAPEFPAPPQYV